MPKIILTTSPGFATLGDGAGRIADAGFELVRHAGPGRPERLAEARYLVAGLPAVNAATLAAAPALRAVLKHGVGLDSIDVAAASERGVAVTSTPGANAQSVAEMALGAMFGLARNAISGHATVVSGGWTRRPGRELAGATLGILGFGQIGQRLARMARGIGMAVLAHDPFPAKAAAAELGVALTDFDTLLASADYLSLHLAGGPESSGLIGADAIARMKPGAALVNFARGSIVDLDALAVALASGHLAGAAIDAYAQEPPDLSHPIFRAPNVQFSPHSGADTLQAIARTSGMVLDDILAFERGETPARTVNARELCR